MNQESVFSTAMSRRSFNRAVLYGAAAAMMGGGALLEGCGEQQTMRTDLRPADIGTVGINEAAATDGLQPAVRLNPPENQPDPSSQDIRELFQAGALYRRFDVAGQKLVTLTFDDGPWPINTVSIMDTLARNGLEGSATFFQVGDNMVQFLEIGEVA